MGLYVLLASHWMQRHAQQQQQAHETQLQQMSTRALANTQSGLETRLSELSLSIDLFARSNLSIIQDLIENPDAESANYHHLLALLKKTYPDVVAFTLANAEGDPILEVFPGLIGQPCKHDIKVFSRHPAEGIKRLHPDMKLSHFDVMTQLNTGATTVIFFANFLTPIITTSLNTFSGNDVEVMLIHRDVPNMIEFTEQGARGEYRRNWRLQPEEQARIRQSVDIEGSRWTLVAMPQESITTELAHQLAHDQQHALNRVVIVGIAWLLLMTILVNAVCYQMSRVRNRHQSLEKQVHHDTLTGLPNRLLLMARLKLTLEHVQRSDGMAAVLFVDLDGFKQINDQKGHAVGDRVLESVADALTQLRSTDTVSRLAGDEFVVVLNDLKNKTSAEQIAQQLLDEISKIQQQIDLPHGLTASIGIAFYPENGTTTDELLECADQAMYRAKMQGGNCFC